MAIRARDKTKYLQEQIRMAFVQSVCDSRQYPVRHKVPSVYVYQDRSESSYEAPLEGIASTWRKGLFSHANKNNIACAISAMRIAQLAPICPMRGINQRFKAKIISEEIVSTCRTVFS